MKQRGKNNWSPIPTPVYGPIINYLSPNGGRSLINNYDIQLYNTCVCSNLLRVGLLHRKLICMSIRVGTTHSQI